MPKHRILRALLLLIACLGAGCGSSQQSFVFDSPTNGGQAPSVITGSFSLGRFVSGGDASIEALDGLMLATTKVGASGNFVFASVSLPADFRIRCVPAGTTAAFFADVRGYTGSGRSVVVNVPTSLVSLYLKAHPGDGLEAANQKVRRLLGLGSQTSLEYGLSESARSPFSHLAFFVDAAKVGGWATLSSKVVADLETVSVSSQQSAAGDRDPYRAERADLTASLQGLEPGLLTHVQPLQTFRPLVLSFIGGATKKVLGFVGENLLTTALDAGVDTAWTKTAESLGLNFGTTVALDEIEQELGEVLTDLFDLTEQLSDDDYKAAANELSPSIAYIQTLTQVKDPSQPSSTAGTLESAVDAAIIAGDDSRDKPFETPSPNSSIGVLLGQLAGFNTAVKLTLIQDYQLDGFQVVNMNTLWKTNKVDNVLATDAGPGIMGFPWRSNQWLDMALQNYGFYGTYQELAGYWLAENARQSTDLGTSLNLINGTLDSVAVSLKAQRGQFPQYLPSDQVLVDLQFGLMWYSTAQSPQTYDSALSAADQLVVTGDAYDGEVTYDDWRLPTYNELKALQDRARFYNGGYDTSVPSHTHTGYGDTGESTAGLPGLGFLGVAEAFTSSENGGQASDGGMWFASYWYSGVGWYSTYYDPLHGSTSRYSELEFNYENKDPNYKDDPTDKRPFLLCRTIDHPLLNPADPHAFPSIEKPSPVPAGSYPNELKPTPIQKGEYPGLGVLTNLTNPVAISLSKVSATLEFTVNLGGDFSTGNAVASEQQSVPQFSAKASLSTYSGAVNDNPQLNALILLPWFEAQSTDSAVLVSNYPPAYDGTDGVQGLITAINTLGSSGTIIKNTDTSDTVPATFTATAYGYNPSNGIFPYTFQANASLSQFGSYENGKPRQPTQLQVSPRNRIYDGTSPFLNGHVTTENYNAALFYDNLTVAKKTASVTWKLLDPATGKAYSGDAASLSTGGQLQVDLEKVPTAGLTLQIKASLSGLPADAPDSAQSDTVSFSATKQI